MYQGYARDVIDVIEDDTGSTVKALLYRGTPENPAFWKRAFFDLTYAAGKYRVKYISENQFTTFAYRRVPLQFKQSFRWPLGRQEEMMSIF